MPASLCVGQLKLMAGMEFIAARHAVEELNAAHRMENYQKQQQQQQEESALSQQLHSPDDAQLTQEEQQQQQGLEHGVFQQHYSAEESSSAAAAAAAATVTALAAPVGAASTGIHEQAGEYWGSHRGSSSSSSSSRRSSIYEREIAELNWQAGGGSGDEGRAGLQHPYAHIHLGDRPVGETVRAMWGSMSPFRRLKFMFGLLKDMLFLKVSEAQGWLRARGDAMEVAGKAGGGG